MMSGTYLLSFFLIQVKGLNQLSAGLIISTMSLTSMCFSLLATILTKKIGSRLTSALGILLLSVSCYLNSSLTQNSSNVVQTIQNDTVFNNEAKQQMISSIKAGNNKNVNLSEILKTIDKKETAVLASSPAMAEHKIKKIVPNIQDTFLTYTVKSFSFTFKVSAVILLPGILFALFSDKKRTTGIE